MGEVLGGGCEDWREAVVALFSFETVVLVYVSNKVWSRFYLDRTRWFIVNSPLEVLLGTGSIYRTRTQWDQMMSCSPERSITVQG